MPKKTSLQGRDNLKGEDWKDSWKLGLSHHSTLWELHKLLRDEIMKRWNRALPFNEELFDRWERAKFLDFGEDTSIYDSSIVIGDVKVGKSTWIGPFTMLDGSGGLKIGNFCSISTGVQIYTHDSVKWSLSGGKSKYKYAPVEIEDCCYIGPLSLITKGVKIGKHSLIGATSFVNKDIPSFSIAFGTPAKVVGKVEIEDSGEVKLVYKEMDKERS